MIKDVEMVASSLTCTCNDLTDADLWHKRLFHIRAKEIRELTKQGLLPKGLCEILIFCETCVLSKATRQSFTTSQHIAKGILNYIHLDLWRPAQTPTLSGSRYFLTFVDDFSRKTWIFFLKSKDRALEKFKDWKKIVEIQTNRSVRYLRTDNGLEFCGEKTSRLKQPHMLSIISTDVLIQQMSL